jgi:endo-1,4-beta-mannosidase
VTDRFDVGVNYWPASSAMRWWRRFDATEVDRDFARIREAGGDIVRFFLLWEDFQPEPNVVSERSLADLVTVADSAQRHGLRIMPTLFTGHMSGANFIPDWALGSGAAPNDRFRIVALDRVVDRPMRNWYADPIVFEAQALLARESAAALAGHRAMWGWDLGNENSNCCAPPTSDDGVRWLERMASEIRSVDPSCGITIGLHMEDLEEDRRIGPAEAARVCDVLCMHGYPIYAAWSRSPVDSELLPFLADVTRWLAGGEKDVLFAEFGAPTKDGDPEAERIAGGSLLTEDEAARYTASAFDRLRSAGATGGLVWCYADYDPAIWSEPPLDRAPHERHFGLWRADGRPKPAAATLARASGARLRPTTLPWSDAERKVFYDSPRDTLVRLYRAYTEGSTAVRAIPSS